MTFGDAVALFHSRDKIVRRVGGNRKFWDDVAREKGINIEVTAVEFDPEIAKAYAKRYPNDNVIIRNEVDYEIG